MQKPILFLDFDRTLFDTGQFYEWLGDTVDERIAALMDGTLSAPDFPSMLYADTLSFLASLKKTHYLVLLTYTAHITRALQEKKVFGSGVAGCVDEVLIVSGLRGSGGKAREVGRLVGQRSGASKSHVFVDDRPENIDEVKAAHPNVRCVRIERMSQAADEQLPEGLLPADDVVTDLSQLRLLLEQK